MAYQRHQEAPVDAARNAQKIREMGAELGATLHRSALQLVEIAEREAAFQALLDNAIWCKMPWVIDSPRTKKLAGASCDPKKDPLCGAR